MGCFVQLMSIQEMVVSGIIKSWPILIYCDFFEFNSRRRSFKHLRMYACARDSTSGVELYNEVMGGNGRFIYMCIVCVCVCVCVTTVYAFYSHVVSRTHTS